MSAVAVSMLALDPRARAPAGDGLSSLGFSSLREWLARARARATAPACQPDGEPRASLAPPARAGAILGVDAIEILDCPWNRPVAPDVSGLVAALQARDFLSARKAYGARLREG